MHPTEVETELPSSTLIKLPNSDRRPVRLAYQPPANSTFLSEQTSHQQSASSTLLSEQTSTSHQPPANRGEHFSGRAEKNSVISG
jgi:hypothetical protein